MAGIIQGIKDVMAPRYQTHREGLKKLFGNWQSLEKELTELNKLQAAPKDFALVDKNDIKTLYGCQHKLADCVATLDKFRKAYQHVLAVVKEMREYSESTEQLLIDFSQNKQKIDIQLDQLKQVITKLTSARDVCANQLAKCRSAKAEKRIIQQLQEKQEEYAKDLELARNSEKALQEKLRNCLETSSKFGNLAQMQQEMEQLKRHNERLASINQYYTTEGAVTKDMLKELNNSVYSRNKIQFAAFEKAAERVDKAINEIKRKHGIYSTMKKTYDEVYEHKQKMDANEAEFNALKERNALLSRKNSQLVNDLYHANLNFKAQEGTLKKLTQDLASAMSGVQMTEADKEMKYKSLIDNLKVQVENLRNSYFRAINKREDDIKAYVDLLKQVRQNEVVTDKIMHGVQGLHQQVADRYAPAPA